MLSHYLFTERVTETIQNATDADKFLFFYIDIGVNYEVL